jgi:transcription termination factor Rho
LRLDDLQKIPFQELLDKASEVGVENPGGMLKYELIFEILHRHAMDNGRVAGEGNIARPVRILAAAGK